MSVNSISGSTQELNLKPNSTLDNSDRNPNIVAPGSDSNTKPEVLANKVASEIKDSKNITTSNIHETENKSQKIKPSKAISHVVEVYNQRGELRTKFMDSNNNVIYQIPPEMVSKIEDMFGSKKTADTKG